MTDRERWTVYPLLFLALGVSLKDKMVRTVNTDKVQCKVMSGDDVRCKTLVCNELLVTTPGSNKQVRLFSGEVLASGDMKAPALICNAMIIAGANGKKAVTVSSNNQGGFVEAVGAETGTITFLGNTDRIAGLLFVDAHGVVHPGPLFAPPVPARKPADESPPTDAATPPAQQEPEPQPQPAGEEKTDAAAPAEKAPAASDPKEKSASAQPE